MASGLGVEVFGPRFPGDNAPKAPAAHWRRQSDKVEEQSPSRRRMAPVAPVPVARSISAIAIGRGAFYPSGRHSRT